MNNGFPRPEKYSTSERVQCRCLRAASMRWIRARTRTPPHHAQSPALIPDSLKSARQHRLSFPYNNAYASSLGSSIIQSLDPPDAPVGYVSLPIPNAKMIEITANTRSRWNWPP
jgi:hypothetical protein